MNVRNINELIKFQKQRGATETDGQWVCINSWLSGVKNECKQGAISPLVACYEIPLIQPQGLTDDT